MIIPVGVLAADPVHAIPLSQNLTVNKTYTLDSSNSTPATLWVGAIVLGVILVILSFLSFPNGEEGLVSIMAWIPIGFAMYTALSVDSITNAGTVASSIGITQVESHTIYQFNLIAMLLMIFLAIAIGNTYRIWVSQKKMKELTEGPATENFDY
jgi:lysylphosphatidylglycerol synthetase-like protein (DUF2156 family)